MTIIQRRVFYGKVGSADDLLSWAEDMYAVIQVNNPEMKQRILSDYQSGQTDRVVVEIELRNIGELDTMLEKTFEDPATQQRFSTVFERLKPLIDRAEVENWTIH